MFFGTVKHIITFINGSPKRETMIPIKQLCQPLMKPKRRQLVKLCETRWVEKKTSILVFRQLCFGTITTLDYLIENGHSETSALARIYEKPLSTIDFAVSLIVVNRVCCIIKSCAEQLQKPTCDLVKLCHSIEQVSMYLTELIYDDEQLDKLYNEFCAFLECNDIDNRLSQTACQPYKTVKDYFADVKNSWM